MSSRAFTNYRNKGNFAKTKEPLGAEPGAIGGVGTVALGFHVVTVDESQRSRIDAVAQAAAISRAIREHKVEVAVAMGRANLGATHAVRSVAELVDVGRHDRLRETRPAAARLELVGRSEQRLARDDVDVDAGLLIAEVGAATGAFGRVLVPCATVRRQLCRAADFSSRPAPLP